MPISTKAFAQETTGPSLRETREFIQKHLQTSTFNYSKTVWKGRPEEKTEFGTISQNVAGDTNVKFQGNPRCFVIVNRTTKHDIDDRKLTVVFTAFDAKTLDLQGIKATTISVGDSHFSGVLLPHEINTNGEVPKEPWVLVDDDATAERLAQAFRHLGELCGAKKRGVLIFCVSATKRDPGEFMKLPFAFVSFLLTFGSIASGGASPSFVARGTAHFTTGAEFAQLGSPEFHQAFQRALALADSNHLTSLRGEPEEVTEGASPSFKTSFILQWRVCSLVDDSSWTLDCSIDTDRTGSNLQALFTQVTAEAESLGTLEKLPRRRIDNPNQNRYRSPAGSVVDINAIGKTFIQVTFASPPLVGKNSAK